MICPRPACDARVEVTHSQDRGATFLRRRRCRGCDLRLVTQEQPLGADSRAQDEEVLFVLKDPYAGQLWLGVPWPKRAVPDLVHIGDFRPMGRWLEPRFLEHYAAWRRESQWFDDSIESRVRLMLELDPRGYLVGGQPLADSSVASIAPIPQTGARCPDCRGKAKVTRTMQTSPTDVELVRERCCRNPSCGARWWTVERPRNRLTAPREC